MGECRKALEFHEKALTIAREIGDKRNEGTWLGNLGSDYANLDEISKAIEFYEKQLVIAREVGDLRGEGNALGNLGITVHNLGKTDKGISQMKQALTIFQTIESPKAEWARERLKEWGVKE